MNKITLNNYQLQKTSKMKIQDLNILLSEKLTGLFHKMKTKDLNVCPLCGKKIKYISLKSNLKDGNYFICESCGRFENPFDLFFSYNLTKELKQKINSKKIKEISKEVKKPIFNETLKELFKMVSNRLLREKTEAEFKIKKIKAEILLKEKEKLEKINSDEFFCYAFEKFNQQFMTNYRSNNEILMKANILDDEFLKFELSKSQLTDLYLINPSFYSLKNFNFIAIKNEKGRIASFLLERKEITPKYKNKFSFLKYDQNDILFNIDNFVKTKQNELYVLNDFETIEEMKNNGLFYNDVVATLAESYSYKQKLSLIKYFKTKIYVCFKNLEISKQLKKDLEFYGIDSEILDFEEFKIRKGLK